MFQFSQSTKDKLQKVNNKTIISIPSVEKIGGIFNEFRKVFGKMGFVWYDRYNSETYLEIKLF